MWGRNIKWCVGIILAVALTIAVTMTLQNWQRSHFDCSGELVMEYPDIRGDISVRYVLMAAMGWLFYAEKSLIITVKSWR